MIIIGIDPGVTGAVAILNSDGSCLVHDIPTVTTGAQNNRKRIDAEALKDLLYPYADKSCIAFVEKTHAMPLNGSVASYSQGDSNGVIRMGCACAEIQVEWITPQSWKSHYRLKRDKDSARILAIELFPDAPLSRKKDHNRAEALLIAYYGKATSIF